MAYTSATQAPHWVGSRSLGGGRLFIPIINALGGGRDLCTVPNVIQCCEIQPLSRELLQSLFLRGGHHLLGPGDVLAAGQRANLSPCHFLLVDLYGLCNMMNIGLQFSHMLRLFVKQLQHACSQHVDLVSHAGERLGSIFLCLVQSFGSLPRLDVVTLAVGC